MIQTLDDHWNSFPHKERIPLTREQKNRFISDLIKHHDFYNFCVQKRALDLFNNQTTILHMPIAQYLKTYAADYQFRYDDTDECTPYIFWRMVYEQTLQDTLSQT